MELSIDTVGERSSVAVSRQGDLLAEITWTSGRRHTPTLTPMIDRVCQIAGDGADIRAELEAVFVDVGPGTYGGIRAGMAAAQGLAVTLGLTCVGVGRLEIEAYAHASADLVCAIHRAARETWAWQNFAGNIEWRARRPPRTGTIDQLFDDLGEQAERTGLVGGVMCGEPQLLSAAVQKRLLQRGWWLAPPELSVRRAGLLAALGWERLTWDGGVPPAALEPLYLRDPAIGPQPQPTQSARATD